MSDKPTHIPGHWDSASVEELAEFVTSGSRGWARYYADDGPLFLRVGNLSHSTVGLDLSEVAHVHPPEGAEGERTRIRSGDVLLSITAEVGMVGLAPDGLPEAYVNQHVALVRPRSAVWAPGLAYAFLDPQGLQALARKSQYGATKPGLSLTQVRSFRVGVPPIAEQGRIVEAIESYFTRLDDAVATLGRVQRNVKRYRASVLKAAVEGRLVPTEAELARAEGRDYEPAAVLLDRILAERRRRWAESGRRGKDEEPVAPDTTDLPDLPEGWCWARIGVVGEVRLGRQRAPQHHVGQHMRPYLRVANVFEDRIDTTDVMEMNFDAAEYKTYRLERGDILLNEGQSPHLVGRPAMYRGELPGACFQNTLVRFRALPGVEPGYALIVFRAQLHAQRYLKIAKITTNIAHLGAERFSTVEFPLPPLVEQRRIVSVVDDALSLAAAVEQTGETSIGRCVRLRQAVLKWAFEGRLVDQDPTDEPASALLERIRSRTVAKPPGAVDTEERRAGKHRRRRGGRGERKP